MYKHGWTTHWTRGEKIRKGCKRGSPGKMLVIAPYIISRALNTLSPPTSSHVPYRAGSFAYVTHPRLSGILPCWIPLSCSRSLTIAGPGSSPPPWNDDVSFLERSVTLLIGTRAAAVPAAQISSNLAISSYLIFVRKSVLRAPRYGFSRQERGGKGMPRTHRSAFRLPA